MTDAEIVAQAEAEAQAAFAPEPPATVEEPEEAAVEETAAPDETTVAAEEEEPAAEEDESEDTSDEAVETESSESVDFNDLLSEIPPDEAILRTHTRIPQATKDALLDLAGKAREARSLLEPLGGEEGVKSFEPIAAMLQKAEPTSEDFQAGIGAMFARNPTSTIGMIAEAAEELLFNRENTPDARAVAKFGETILENRFGIGPDKIEKYALLEKGGFNVDEEIELWHSEGERSTLFQNMQSTLEEREAKIAELQKLVDNPDQIRSQTAAHSTAVKALEEDIAKRVHESTSPFRERIKWGDDSPLTTLTMRALMADIKETPAYQEAVKFAAKQGHKPDNLNVNLLMQQITNMAKVRFSEAATNVNKQLRSLSETSLNAQREKQVKEKTTPKPVPVAPASNRFSMFGDDIGGQIDKIISEARAA